MKNNLPTSALTNSTALSIFLITVVAIAAVFAATYQVDRGVVAPTAPQSQPEAAEISSQNCRLTFDVVPVGPTANLQLQKTVNDSTPNVGDEVTFTITLTNAGPDQATGVTIEDILPTGVTFVSANPSVGDFNSATGIWNVGTILPNTSFTLGLTVRVDVSTQIINIAQVETSETEDPTSEPGNSDPTEDDQDDEVLNPTNPGANLELKKRVNNSTPTVGDNVTFTVEVYNSGPDQATGVTVEDILPTGAVFVSSAPSVGSYNIANGIWSIGNIDKNQTVSIEIVAKIISSNSMRNIAQVETNNVPDPNSTPGNDNPNEDDYGYADVVPQQNGADLSLTKRVSNQTPNVGDEITFTIEVHNAGPNQTNNVTVRDLVPQGVTFIGANASQGNYNSGNGIWSIGSLTKGSTVRLDMKVRVNVTGQIRNIAEVMSSSEPDPNSTPGNNNPTEDDYDERTIGKAGLPKAGSNSRTTLFVVATGIVVLIIGAMGLLLFL